MRLSELECKWFCDLAREIMARGLAKKQTSCYATSPGGTLAHDGQDNVVVIDGNREMAQLKPLKIHARQDDYPVL